MYPWATTRSWRSSMPQLRPVSLLSWRILGRVSPFRARQRGPKCSIRSRVTPSFNSFSCTSDLTVWSATLISQLLSLAHWDSTNSCVFSPLHASCCTRPIGPGCLLHFVFGIIATLFPDHLNKGTVVTQELPVPSDEASRYAHFQKSKSQDPMFHRIVVPARVRARGPRWRRRSVDTPSGPGAFFRLQQ